MLTIQERIKDLRVEHGLTLQQLAEQTGLSASALGNYENDEFKDIGHFAIVKLAKFYGVTTDYLLGLSETKKHSTADINSLRLSDKTISLLQQGTINIPLLCEILESDGFGKLLADTEIYANGYATELIRSLNAYLDAGREQIIKQGKNISPDSILYALENVQIDEGEYFAKRIHDDMDIILKDLRTAHSGCSESALGDPIYDPIRMLKDAMKEYQNFRGSPAEKRMMLFCKHNDIPYAQLTDEEKAALLRIMGKSRMMKGGVSRRGKR